VNRGDVWFADWYWYWYRGIEEVVDEGSWNRVWVMRMWHDKRGWVSLGCLMRHQASRQGFFPPLVLVRADLILLRRGRSDVRSKINVTIVMSGMFRCF
jgi:hypothetical protein